MLLLYLLHTKRTACNTSAHIETACIHINFLCQLAMVKFACAHFGQYLHMPLIKLTCQQSLPNRNKKWEINFHILIKTSQIKVGSKICYSICRLFYPLERHPANLFVENRYQWLRKRYICGIIKEKVTLILRKG